MGYFELQTNRKTKGFITSKIRKPQVGQLWNWLIRGLWKHQGPRFFLSFHRAILDKWPWSQPCAFTIWRWWLETPRNHLLITTPGGRQRVFYSMSLFALQAAIPLQLIGQLHKLQGLLAGKFGGMTFRFTFNSICHTNAFLYQILVLKQKSACLRSFSEWRSRCHKVSSLWIHNP